MRREDWVKERPPWHTRVIPLRVSNILLLRPFLGVFNALISTMGEGRGWVNFIRDVHRTGARMLTTFFFIIYSLFSSHNSCAHSSFSSTWSVSPPNRKPVNNSRCFFYSAPYRCCATHGVQSQDFLGNLVIDYFFSLSCRVCVFCASKFIDPIIWVMRYARTPTTIECVQFWIIFKRKFKFSQTLQAAEMCIDAKVKWDLWPSTSSE